MPPRAKQTLFTATVYYEDFSGQCVTLKINEGLSAGYACPLFCRKAGIEYRRELGIFPCGYADDISDDEEVHWLSRHDLLGDARFPEPDPVLVVRPVGLNRFHSNQGLIQLTAYWDELESEPLQVSVDQAAPVGQIWPAFCRQYSIPLHPYRAVLEIGADRRLEEIPDEISIRTKKWEEGQEIFLQKVPRFIKLHIHADQLTFDPRRRHDVHLFRFKRVSTIRSICDPKFQIDDPRYRVYRFDRAGRPVALQNNAKVLDLNLPKWSTLVCASGPPVCPRLNLRMENAGDQREILVQATQTLKEICDSVSVPQSSRYTLWRDCGAGREFLPQEWSPFDLELEDGTTIHYEPVDGDVESDSSGSDEGDEHSRDDSKPALRPATDRRQDDRRGQARGGRGGSRDDPRRPRGGYF
jgi:hypothetical protein